MGMKPAAEGTGLPHSDGTLGEKPGKITTVIEMPLGSMIYTTLWGVKGRINPVLSGAELFS